jgi:tRNA dimethylallyltransferase
MKIVPFILGPTGIGKTELSLQLGKKLPIEIISADSRQIYKFLDIGTAKPSPEILHKIKHHFVDYLSPDDYYSAGMFGREARVVIDQVFKLGKIPLVVGGSGFYIQALIDGLSDIVVSDQKIRQNLRQRLVNEGVEKLYEQLRSVDPDLAKNININDSQRILRGLEVYYSEGKPLSKLQLHKPIPANFKPLLLGLTADRKFLYEKINNRVDEMIALGLVKEVKRLKKKGFSEKDNALNSVGYKEVFDHLNGMLDYDSMIEKIKINSRRYAKRQLTWFRKDDRITWFNRNDFQQSKDLLDKISDQFNLSKLI